MHFSPCSAPAIGDRHPAVTVFTQWHISMRALDLEPRDHAPQILVPRASKKVLIEVAVSQTQIRSFRARLWIAICRCSFIFGQRIGRAVVIGLRTSS